MAKKRKYSLGADITGVAFAGTGCGPATTPLTDPNTGGSAAPAGTTFVSGPGKTLTNVHVQLIFWGAWWNYNPLAAQVNNAVADLLAGPYMTYLAQYGVHRGNVRGKTFANDSEPGTFSFKSVGKFIINLLDENRLPEPDEDWPIVYAVIMPANSALSAPPGTVSNVTGANGSIIWSDYDIFDKDNDPAYFFGLETMEH